MATRTFQTGVMFRCQNAPEDLQRYVQRAEAAGLDEFYVVEDCFFGGGISSATAALGFSESIKIALGIMPAVVRNPAFIAMEIATLARLYPGRFLPGIGHGVTEWMRQIGALPKSQLTALEEVTVAVRSLLRGETVTMHGQHVSIEDVKLVFPPEQVPPISLGVRGPKSLALAGRVADGTILAEFTAPAYVKWAREQIAAGQGTAGREDHHKLTVFAWCSLDGDGAAARQRLRPLLADGMAKGWVDAHLEPLGILPEVKKLVETGGEQHLAENMPDEWLSLLALVGTADDVAAGMHALAEAGADAVILVPVGDEFAILDAIGESLLPALG